MNEDSDWWTAAIADMDTATVRGWCLDGDASGAMTGWSWWEGLRGTAGWQRAREECAAAAAELDAGEWRGARWVARVSAAPIDVASPPRAWVRRAGRVRRADRVDRHG